MSGYTYRKAGIGDLGFLIEAIVEADKSGTDKVSFCTLFDISEAKYKELLALMLEEDFEGCEYSIGSFLVCEHDGKPVATISGWIEQFDDNPASQTIRSNLINYYFPKESIEFARSNSKIIGDIRIERYPMSLQIFMVYTRKEHRGHKLGQILLQEHFDRAIIEYPQLLKAQLQVYGNNVPAIKLYERIGFKTVEVFEQKHEDILDYLPSNEILLMEYNFK